MKKQRRKKTKVRADLTAKIIAQLTERATASGDLLTKVEDLEKEVANLRFELVHKDRERRFWAAMFHAAKTYVAHAIKQEDMMGKDTDPK